MIFSILDELEINYDNWDTNPEELLKRVHAIGMDLVAILDKSETMSDIQRMFTEKALENEAAAERAKEIIDELNNILLVESAEIVANVLAMLPQTIQLGHSMVQSMGIREYSPELPKPIVHQQFVNLRKWMDQYMKLADMGLGMIKNMPEKVKRDKYRLPAKSGSYVPKKNGLKIYSYTVDGESYTSPYAVAKLLGIWKEGMMWMDIQNELLTGNYPTVEMQEL